MHRRFKYSLRKQKGPIYPLSENSPTRTNQLRNILPALCRNRHRKMGGRYQQTYLHLLQQSWNRNTGRTYSWKVTYLRFFAQYRTSVSSPVEREINVELQ